MAKQPRHPYVTLRWYAAGVLAICLINWLKHFGESVCRVLDGERDPSFLYQAAFAQPILWIAAFAGAWLVALLRPSRATPWLTSFTLLLPYAWLVCGLIYVSWAHFARGKVVPEAIVAQVVIIGLIYAYHRSAWMWWWQRRHEAIQAPT